MCRHRPFAFICYVNKPAALASGRGQRKGVLGSASYDDEPFVQVLETNEGHNKQSDFVFYEQFLFLRTFSLGATNFPLLFCSCFGGPHFLFKSQRISRCTQLRSHFRSRDEVLSWFSLVRLPSTSDIRTKVTLFSDTGDWNFSIVGARTFQVNEGVHVGHLSAFRLCTRCTGWWTLLHRGNTDTRRLRMLMGSAGCSQGHSGDTDYQMARRAAQVMRPSPRKPCMRHALVLVQLVQHQRRLTLTHPFLLSLVAPIEQKSQHHGQDFESP